MKKILTFFVALMFTASLFASNTPANLEDGKTLVAMEMSQLDQIEQIIMTEGLTFDQLTEKYPNLVAEANLLDEVAEDGLLDSAPDSPLGIPGFAWGFVCGLCGLLIVYLAMDEGADRKEQIKYAVYGCIASSIISGIYWAIAAI